MVFPRDEALGLLPGPQSLRLAEGVMRLARWRPFAQAAEHLACCWGVRRSADTLRRTTEAAGAA